MKFTLSWLKDHLDTGATLGQITDALTSLGLVVDAVEDPSKRWGAFRVAEIVEASPHPQADRLKLCQVQFAPDSAPIQVVCGASNARKGLKTILALPGDIIPATGQPLKKGSIRGVESPGMLCSYDELLLEAHKPEGAVDGIMEIDPTVAVGTPLTQVFGLNDPVIEIEVTPNRGDALGIRGIARDLVAKGLGTLKPFPEVASGISPQAGDFVQITPQAATACPLFSACLIRGVQNKLSPAWLQERLRAVGLNPISALVDVTNYLAYDLGRPLHVFDAERLQGGLSIDLSKDGEIFEALDDKTYTLPAGLVVIRDESGTVQSLAGVMGGAPSGCQLDTQDVVLESAFFTPTAIGDSGKATGIHSDSRARFERGADSEMVLPGLARAAHLIQSICGGQVEAAWMMGEGMPKKDPETISFSAAFVTQRTGLSPDPQRVTQILQDLGFEPVFTGEGGPSWTVRVPSWRFDCSIPEDLVEEVVRVLSYDAIPSQGLPLKLPHPQTPKDLALQAMREDLVATGFFEVVTWSFLSLSKAHLFGGGDKALQLKNPISRELAVMRPSLLPNLLDTFCAHLKRSLPCAPMFEMGASYHGIRPEDQRLCLTGVMPLGDQVSWRGKTNVDVFDLKAVVLSLLETWGIKPKSLQTEVSDLDWFHPGRQGVFKQGPKVLSTFGEVHPTILKTFDLNGRWGGFEVMLDNLPPHKQVLAKPPVDLSVYQPVTQDFALVMAAQTPVEKLIRAVEKAGRNQVMDLQLFDVFEDADRLGEGKKSVALRVTWQSTKGTLTEGDITALRTTLLDQANHMAGAVLRDA